MSKASKLANTNRPLSKEIEVIKAEIEKLLPSKPKLKLKPKQKQPLNERTQDHEEKLVFRKTISHLVNVFPQNIDLGQNAIRMSQTQNDFNQKKTGSKSKQINKRNEGDEPQTEYMSHWRQEMMKHIRPQRIVKMDQQQVNGQKMHPFHKMVQQTRAQTSEKNILKVKSPSPPSYPMKAKPKFNQQLQLRASSKSQKNLILIRPTTIKKEGKSINEYKGKRSVFQLSRQSVLDKFFQKRSSQFDEMTLQRIANFEALLPFLGAQRASVEQKPQSRSRNNEYDAQMSRKKQKKQRKKSPTIIPYTITGWDVPEDKQF